MLHLNIIKVKTPEEMGLVRLGEEESISCAGGAPEEETEIRGLHLSPAVCLPVVLFLVLVSMITMGFTQILPSFGESRGLSPTAASMLVSLSMLGNTVGKFSMGAESDRFGVLRVAVVAFFLPLLFFIFHFFDGNPNPVEHIIAVKRNINNFPTAVLLHLCVHCII